MYIFKTIETAETEIIKNFDGCTEKISDIRQLMDDLKANSIGKYNGNIYVIDTYNLLDDEHVFI